MGKIIVHVGYPKTGSTFLQKDVFPKIKNVNFLTNDLNNFDFKNVKKDKLNILSREGLFGLPHESDLKTGYQRINEIKKNFPDAHIILIIREKKPWIKSLYKQYITGGGKYNFKKWFLNNFDLGFLDYEKNIKYLEKNFKQVLVLKFENLKKDPDKFVKDICDFIGVEVPKYENKIRGKSPSKTTLTLIRFVNHFFKAYKPYRKMKRWLFRKKYNKIQNNK